MSTTHYEALVAGLRAEDWVVQADAARLLGELGRAEAVEPLLAYVSDCRAYYKVAGLYALARIGDRRACPVLRRLVEQANAPDDWYWYGYKGLRAAAAVSLLALGDGAGAGYLGELADRNDDVFYAWFAPAILRLDGSSSQAAALKGRLTAQGLFDVKPTSTRFANAGTAAMVAEALGLLGDEAARARLRELAGHQSRYVRGQAAVSLAQAHAAAEAAFVAELGEKDPTEFVKIKAAFALARAGVDGWADRLAALAARVKDSFDLAVAVEAMGLAGRAQDGEAIRKRLAHKDPYVRQTAVEALDRLGGPEAQAAVRPRLKDRDPRVRLSAAKFFAARQTDQA